MVAEIIALAHICRELFPIMDTVKLAMHISIHEDDAGALILAETLQSQCTH